MAQNTSQAAASVSYHSHRARFAWLPAIGVFSLLLPLLIFWIKVPDAPLTGLTLSLLLGPIGIGFVLIGVAHLRLRIEIGEQGLSLALPLAGTEPWFPWQVRRAAITWEEFTHIDTMAEANVHAPHGQERRAMLRTHRGDYFLTSIWFPQYQEILAKIKDKTGLEIADKPLKHPHAKLQWSERFVRGAGWTIIAGGMLFSVIYGVLSLSGRVKNGSDVFFLVLLFWMASPWINKLIGYRKTV